MIKSTVTSFSTRCFTKDDNRKIQTLQNMVLRLKTDMPRRTPTQTLLTLSGDLSVQQLTAQATLTSLQKVIYNGKPQYLADKLKTNIGNNQAGEHNQTEI